jgi:hypothetical protein
MRTEATGEAQGNEYPPLRTPVDSTRPPAFHEMNENPIVSNERFKEASLFGIGGAAQYGADGVALCAETSGTVVLSCKCYEATSPAQLAEWSDEFLDHIDGYWKNREVRRFVLTTAETNITAVKISDQIEKERTGSLLEAFSTRCWGRNSCMSGYGLAQPRFVGFWGRYGFGPCPVHQTRGLLKEKARLISLERSWRSADWNLRMPLCSMKYDPGMQPQYASYSRQVCLPIGRSGV